MTQSWHRFSTRVLCAGTCRSSEPDSILHGLKTLKTRATDQVHSKNPPRNRLAKPLPEEWRRFLVERGVPKRKYTAVCTVTIVGGRIIEELIVEQGWIVALDKAGLTGEIEQRIDFDPRQITALQIVQVV